jgi:hypothetical protein
MLLHVCLWSESNRTRFCEIMNELQSSLLYRVWLLVDKPSLCFIYHRRLEFQFANALKLNYLCTIISVQFGRSCLMVGAFHTSL